MIEPLTPSQRSVLDSALTNALVFGLGVITAVQNELEMQGLPRLTDDQINHFLWETVDRLEKKNT
tara:strand:+ start:342 stop:536 length:195 start_codon:yes stop_codon:yes gene_type:complete